MLYIRSSELIHLISQSLYPFFSLWNRLSFLLGPDLQLPSELFNHKYPCSSLNWPILWGDSGRLSLYLSSQALIQGLRVDPCFPCCIISFFNVQISQMPVASPLLKTFLWPLSSLGTRHSAWIPACCATVGELFPER